jgi:phosphatidylinositol dimannoside acyltransferase
VKPRTGGGAPMSARLGETAHERIAYLGYATVAWLGKTLPTTTGRVLFRWAGSAAFRLMPKVRAVVAANQAQVLGRPADDPLVRASTRRAFRSYARYWFDSFDVATWSDERIREALPFEGLDEVRKLLADGKGVIAVAPHMGNWDAAGRSLLAHGITLLSVAERLRQRPCSSCSSTIVRPSAWTSSGSPTTATPPASS